MSWMKGFREKWFGPVETEFIGFSYAQINFMYWMMRLHVVKHVQSGWLEHPITKKNVAPVVIYQAPRVVDSLVFAVGSKLIGKEGKVVAEQMIAYGAVEVRDE